MTRTVRPPRPACPFCASNVSRPTEARKENESIAGLVHRLSIVLLWSSRQLGKPATPGRIKSRGPGHRRIGAQQSLTNNSTRKNPESKSCCLLSAGFVLYGTTIQRLRDAILGFPPREVVSFRVLAARS